MKQWLIYLACTPPILLTAATARCDEPSAGRYSVDFRVSQNSSASDSGVPRIIDDTTLVVDVKKLAKCLVGDEERIAGKAVFCGKKVLVKAKPDKDGRVRVTFTYEVSSLRKPSKEDAAIQIIRVRGAKLFKVGQALVIPSGEALRITTVQGHRTQYS